MTWWLKLVPFAHQFKFKNRKANGVTHWLKDFQHINYATCACNFEDNTDFGTAPTCLSTIWPFLNTSKAEEGVGTKAMDHLTKDIYDVRSTDYKQHMFRVSLRSAIEEIVKG